MEKKKDQNFKTIRIKLETSFALFSLIIAAILSFSLFVVAKNIIRHDARKHLLELVSLGSNQIDADAHAGLTDPPHENHSAYSEIHQVLKKIQETTVDFCHVYTLRFNDKKKLVRVASAETDTGETSHHGDVYEIADESVIALLSGISKPVVDNDFVSNASGTFLSGYAPFYTSDGRLEGILSIETEMSNVLANERSFLTTAIFMFIFSTPFIVIFTKLLGRNISVPLSSLERSTERQKALTYIFDAAPVGMMMIDENNKVSDINNIATRFVHKDAAEFIGKFPGEGLDCIHSDAHPDGCGKAACCAKCPVEIACQEALSTGKPVSSVEGQVTLLIDKKEVPLWLQISVEPIKLSGSKYFIMSMNDITDLKQSENLIQQQAQIFEQIQGSVITIDLDGHIAAWNKGSEAMLAYTPEEAIGQHVSFVYPDGHEGFLRNKNILLKKDTHEFETELVKKSGKKIFAHVSLSLLRDSEGEITHIVAYSTDVTSRKQTEKQLQDTLNESRAMNDQLLEATGRANDMAADAAQASIAKSEFLANMSHEIRTPMNGVISMVDLALDKDLDEEVYDYLMVCKSSANALLAIINDILDFSKIEAGKIDIEIVKCSTQRILIDIDAMMRSRASEKAVDFDIVFDSEIPQFINSDITRVRQCLLNLVGNGLKFTERGSITIHVSSQTLKDMPAVRFDVKDTGIGIPPEQQKLIFDKFSQADSSTTRKFGGTGLGLAITTQLIELLGGTISVVSMPGEGSTFSMTIPSNIEPGSQPMISKLDRSNLDRDDKPEILNTKLSGNILIAEDDLINQKSIKAILSKTDLTLTIVEDGKQAVDEASTGKYDLVLMDMQMPVMDGTEATAILRKQGSEIPIIAVTANVMKQDIDKCLDAGCNSHLSKPIDRAKLFETLAEYLLSGDEANDSNDQQEPVGQQSAETSEESITSEPELQVESQSESPDADDYGNVLDWAEVIDRFTDEDVIKEIVAAFFVDNPARIEAISDALEAGNFKDMKPLSHTLKGSAGTIGAQLLADRATQLDQAAKEEDIEKAKEIFVQVRKEFDRLQDLVSKPDWVNLVKECAVISS
ncbi:MAG: PAS domain S-box protein [Planctomycetes bacterium]|nr:PAS domain S-box protein [Planctomycetota bacterium]